MNQYAKNALRRPTILIIDDEPSNIHVLSEILKGDYRILFSLSGEDGLRVAEANKPDLILLDVNMPNMNGFTACMRLKENPALKEIPVIFVTMMGALDDEVKGFEVGAVDYITRPIHAVTVLKRIQNHLKIKEHWNILQDMIVIDGLTGIANRRGFDTAFAREWLRATHNCSPFSLILADIDAFKNYNDHYGHTAGDSCLRAIAGVFRRQMQRPHDLAARYGGEEIVCLLPDTDAAGALQVVKRLRVNVAACAIPHKMSPVSDIVTLSFGVATALANTCADPNDLLELADQLMYQAKSSGKNRYVVGELPKIATDGSGHCVCTDQTLSHKEHYKPSLDWHTELRRLEGSNETPTALIIDNDLAQVEALTNVLGQHYRVLSSLSGEDGFKIACAVTPDIILLDTMKPHSSGFDVCKRFSNDPFLKDIPVILVTGMATVYDEAQGFEAGAVDYITRPFQPPIVRNRVRNHLELKMQRDVLRRIATTDSLTGLVNRRGFDEALEREWLRAIRNSATISLILADIDHFKGYNDHYGHIAGDDCLRAVAGIFRRQIQRPQDMAARFGGEELVCLLPDTSASGALLVARRLQASLAACAIPHKASPVADRITLSFGIATASPEESGHLHGAHAFLSLADGCLYEAKHAGRDQIKSGLLTLTASE